MKHSSTKPKKIHPLKPLLSKHNIHQYRLANLLKVSGPAVTLYLTGERPIPEQHQATINNLVKFLEATPPPIDLLDQFEEMQSRKTN